VDVMRRQNVCQFIVGFEWYRIPAKFETSLAPLARKLASPAP
jgi:hypothetical protein